MPSQPCAVKNSLQFGTSKYNRAVGKALDMRKKMKVLPGIEPGLPEDTEVIRIRSDNRYLVGISN